LLPTRRHVPAVVCHFMQLVMEEFEDEDRFANPLADPAAPRKDRRRSINVVAETASSRKYSQRYVRFDSTKRVCAPQRWQMRWVGRVIASTADEATEATVMEFETDIKKLIQNGG
jgi:hypothetical protein